MPSSYLAQADLAAYGVANATAQEVQRASTLVDGYLKRPEGLVWSPDQAGNPCWMTALGPAGAFVGAGPISPGANVQVSVTGPLMMPDLIGEVLVLDRASTPEAVVIAGVQGSVLTLQSVAYSHNPGALLELGMVMLEERAMPAKRSVTRVSRTPVARILSGLGRYAYGRRSDQVAGLYNDTNLLAAIQTFGGPPQWVPFNVDQASVSQATGEIWVPAGLLLAYYSEVRLRYVAGYSLAGLPPVIKQAAATVIVKLREFGDADPMFKKVQAGGTQLERFENTIFDADTKALLEPLRAKLNF